MLMRGLFDSKNDDCFISMRLKLSPRYIWGVGKSEFR